MTPRLVGVREIAQLLSVTRQRADQLSRTKGFPEPVADLANGRIWNRRDVVNWAKAVRRSVPWATVELELEQIPKGPAGSAVMIYRAVWEMTRMKALGSTPEDVPDDLNYAHKLALTEAQKVDPYFDMAMPSEVSDEA